MTPMNNLTRSWQSGAFRLTVTGTFLHVKVPRTEEYPEVLSAAMDTRRCISLMIQMSFEGVA